MRRHARLLLATVVSTASTGAVADAQVRIDLSQRTPTGRISEDIEVLLFATELTDGRLLVTSRRRPTPLVADFTANTLVPVSTVGDGPGEFRRPYWILPMPADSTAVGEEGGGRWVVLQGEKPVVTLRAPTGSAVLRLAGADVHGRVLQMGIASYGTEPGQRVFITHANAESLVVVLHSRARVESGTLFAGRPDTVARLRGSFRGVRNRWYTPPGARMPIQYHLSQPLAPEEQALLFKDGWIAIAYASPYRVDWRAPDGRMIRGTPLPFDAVPVDDRQKEAAIAASWPSGASPFTAGDYPPWPRILPPFLLRSLVPLPNGMVAIARTPDARRPGTVYDLVDRNGHLHGTLRLRQGERVVAFGRTTVYVVQQDQDGLDWLVRYPWPGS